jgi:hypothetical protein
MFLNLPIHNPLLPSRFFDSREKVNFFKVMMFVYLAVPGKTLTDEIDGVRGSYGSGLRVSAIEAAGGGVVGQCHVAGFYGVTLIHY